MNIDDRTQRMYMPGDLNRAAARYARGGWGVKAAKHGPKWTVKCGEVWAVGGA